MNKTKVFLIVQTVLCVLLAGMLSVSAVRIFQEGSARKAEQPMEAIYTWEKAEEKLMKVAPLFFVSLGLTATGLLLGVKGEEKPVQDAESLRDLTAAQVVQFSEAMKRERGKQKRWLLAGWLGFFLCMVPILLYFADETHFPSDDLERMIVSLLSAVLPWIAVGMGWLMVAAVMRERSILREITAANERIREEKAAGVKREGKETDDKNKNPTALQIVVLAAAVVFILVGIFNGSALAVLYKAIKICTECIGLG